MWIKKNKLSLGLVFLLSACQVVSPGPPSSPTAAVPATPAPPPATALAATVVPPSPTPPPVRVGYVWAGAAPDERLAQALEQTVTDLGWTWAPAADHSPEAVRALAQAGAQVLVVAGPQWENAWQIGTTEFPAVYGVALDPLGLSTAPAPAVGVRLGGPETRHDQVAFLGGMVAGLATETLRVAVIGNPQTAVGQKYRNGFLHGARYTCPKCRIDLVDAVDPTTTLTEAGQYARYGNDVFLAAEDELSRAALKAVAERGAWVIGSGEAVYPTLFENGAAAGAENVLTSIYLDPAPAVAAALRAYQAGTPLTGVVPLDAAGGAVVVAPYRLELLSPFDQSEIAAALAHLADGSLETGIDPLTGAEK